MLKKFLYLDELSLAEYVSTLEDGLRERSDRRETSTGTASGGVSVPVLRGDASRSRERENASSYVDSASARFERLLTLAKADPDLAGWVEIVEPASLGEVGVGALIEVECEIYVPDVVKYLSSSSEVLPMLDLLETMRPLAGIFGLEGGSELPAEHQVSGIRNVITTMKNDQVLVGELDDSEWRVAGQMTAANLRGEVDGVARVVGKVARSWSASEWKPLLALPGMSLLPRDQRRKMQKTKPAEDEQQNYLQGPAVMLDLLAVYR